MSFCVLSSVMLSAQDHIYRRNNGNLVITNQYFLDTVDLEGITHIPGNLQIVPSSDSIIHDLSRLSNITHVCTDVDSTACLGLTIQGDNTRDNLGEDINIINLNALSNLQFIGGVGGLFIVNTHLQYLGIFPNLQELSELTVGIGNDHLDSLGSFPALERIETVSLNDSIGNSGKFSVTLNPGMETLGDFSALTYIGGSFRVKAIDDRSMLRTLGNFSSLDSIKGDFEIGKTSVQTLGDFSSLKYIGTGFSVIFNSNLQNLGDFSSLSHVGAITLTDNAMLGNCCGLLSAAVRAVEGEVTVARNGDQGNCSSSGDLIAGCVPMLMPKTILVDHVAGEDTFNLNSVFAWTILVDDESWINDFYYEVGGVRTNFVTISDKKVLTREAGGGETTIYIGYDMNASIMSRVAEFIIEANDVVDNDVVVGRDTFYLNQNPLPPMLTLITTEDTTIVYDETDPIDITFDVGGTATGWDTVSIIGDKFITLSQYMSDLAQGMVTITATPTKNTTLFSRTTTITFTTTGGTGSSVEKTVMITQNPEPPTLMLTTFSDTTIVHNTMDSLSISFVVDGSATGWRASMTGDASFITLSQNMNDMERGTVMIMATPTMNMGSSARTAFINLMTVGGTGDIATARVTIEQGTSMTSLPTIIHSLPSDTIMIPYNGTMATIGFRVGGSATGWMSSIVYTPAGSNFVNLNVANDTTQRGNVDIIVTIMPNETFDERIADIILVTTEGDMGEKASDTITIRQSALPPPPELMVSTFSDTAIVYNTTDSLFISFVVGGSATGWKASITGDNFITLSQNMNDMGRISTERETVMVTATPTANDGLTRIDTMILMTTGGVGAAVRDTIIITQIGAPPTLTGVILYTVNYDATTVPITFNVGGGATGWRVSSIEADIGGEDFITSPNVGYMRNVRGEQMLSFTLEVNGGSRRVSTITLETVGGTGDPVSVDFSIAQRIAPPPTFMLTSDNVISVGTSATTLTDSIEVTFTVGGGALGWTAAVIDGDDDTNDFVTLSKFSGSAGLDTIKVAVSENTGFSRMDTLEITTMGGSGEPLKNTVVITQGGAPPTLMVSTFEDTTIHHNATSLAITFMLGGSAVGWSGTVRGDNFITLSPADADLTTTAREVSVMAVYEANDGLGRKDTIIFTTTGGVADTVVITQEAVPTISVTTPSDGIISIDYNAVTDTTITFDVGGSATGWEVSSDQSFVILDTTNGSSGMGLEVMATVMENMDVLRSATITFSTTGQLGDPVTAEVTITQTGAPGAPVLGVTTPGGDTATVAYTATTDSDSVEIVFTVDNATGWESMISYGAGVDMFVTLTGNPLDTGEVRIKVAVTENDSVARSAKIVLSTTGQTGFSSAKDSLTITQERAPPTLMVSTFEDTTLHHNATEALSITFDLGGGAMGWSGTVRGDNFITLNPADDITATREVSVMAAYEANTGLERTDTIIFTTTDGVSDTVVITQEAVPTIEITDPSNDTISIAYNDTSAQTITFDVGGSATGWTVSSDSSFVTLSSMSGDSVTGIGVTATSTENTGVVARTATITFVTTGQLGDSITAQVMITQDGIPPTLMVSTFEDTIIHHNARESLSITFDLGGSAMGWSGIVRGDNFITLNPADDLTATAGEVSVMATYEANTGLERTDTIIFTTTDGVSDTVVITQEAVPTIEITDPSNDTISIAYNDTSAQTITFDVGGSATGWIASSDSSFVTLSSMSGDSATGIVVTATSTENTGVAARTSTITFVTTGQLGDSITAQVMITQDGIPPTLMVSTFEDTIIHHNARESLSITFDLGGGAMGWSGIVRGDNFITLDPAGPDTEATGEVSVMATYEANTGLERTDTIIFTTTGGVADTVVITQEAVPTIVVTDPSNDTISIAYNDTSAQTITFDVGGSATGWEVSSDSSFVTLSSMVGDSATGIGVTATSTENRGEARTSTITFVTTGQLGDSITAEVMITQGEAPGAPTLSVTTPSGDTTVAYTATTTSDSVEIAFTVGNAMGWESMISYGPGVDEFVTLTGNRSDTGEVRIKLAVTGNDSVERSAKIVLRTTGQGIFSSAKDSLTITQDGAPPTLMVSTFEDTTIHHNATEALTITFDLGGGAVGWSGIVRGDNFITLNPADDFTATAGEVSVMAAYEANTGLERTDTIIFTTTDGVSDTVVITQEAVPTIEITDPSNDTISIAYNDTLAQTITFDVGGSATGWTASSDSSFVTLSSMSGDSATGIGVTATSTENTGVVARTSTITFVTTGQLGDSITAQVMITQDGIPPTLMVSTFEDTIIHHNVTESLSITFDLGGSAMGWSGIVRGDNFITLNPADDLTATAGEVSVMAAYEANTGLERTDTIIFTTTGGVADTVVITQEAVPTIEITDPSNDTISIAYNDTSAQTITFDVGGSATGWTASSDSSFVTLSSMSGTSATGIVVTATSTENTGVVARTSTITFVTTGQLGDSITAEVMIRQAMEEPPTLMLTSFTDGDTIRKNHDDVAGIDIEFTVGGGATGWTSAITGDDFITIGGDTANATTTTGDVTVTATPTENTDMDAVERSATIRITTIGGAGDPVTFAVTITQSASSFDFRVSRPNSIENPDGSWQVSENIPPVGAELATGAEELPIQFRVVPSTAVMTFTHSHFIRIDTSSVESMERLQGGTEDVPARTFLVNYQVAANNTGASRDDGTIIFTARSSVGSQTFTVTFTQDPVPIPTAGFGEITSQTGVFSLDTIRDPDVGHIAAFLGLAPSVVTLPSIGLLSADITDLDSLIFLQSLTGHLIIDGTNITSLRGLDNLTSIEGNLVIQNNSMLTSLEGLEALTYVGGHVLIRDNGALTSLAGLAALTSIGGDVTIVDNENLTSCSGSASLAFAIGVVRDRTTPDGLSITISGNGDECNDVDELINNAPQSAPMLDLTSAAMDTLAHDDGYTSSIVFDVAFATWTAVSNETFVTLSPASGDAGDNQAVTATAGANTTGSLRTATITITAAGADGTTLEEMVTISQEAVPTLSVNNSSFSLGHDEVSARNIVVTLGGSATGWTVSSDSSFVTLSSMSGVNGDSAAFTLSPNTGQARTATLMITTDGSLGSDSTVTVMITQEGAPTLSVAPSSFSIGHDEVGARNVVVTLGGSATGWNASSDSAFVDITTLSGVNGDSVTFTLSPNTGRERTATLMITTDGSLGSDSTVTVMIMQGSIPPTLTLVSDAIDTIAHDSTTANDIEITLGGGAEGWSAASSDTSFIKVPASGTGSMIAVSVVGGANTTGAARTATIMITTRGGTGPAVSKMVMLRQEEAPTFVNNFFNVPTFNVGYDGYADFFLVDAGGSATGWTSSTVYTPPLAPGATGFITLDPDMGNKGDDPMVIVTFDSNITGSKRTGTIKITTTGSKGTAASDTVRITQEAAPTLTLVSNDSIRLGYDEMEEQTIRFNVGGSASGWVASPASVVVNAASATASFVNMNRRSGNLEVDSATFTLDINTGAERTEIIRLRTSGSRGPDSTVAVVITQEAVPTIEVTDPGNDTISIAYNDTSAQTITFDVGGSATGWIASLDSSFVTLSSMIGDSATGIWVTATSTENTGVARTATLMITTDGSLGSDSTVTVMITQGEAPPTLMVSTFEDTTIHHDATEALAITFDLGGSAMGWSGTVRGDNFITLNPADEDLTATGEVTIMAMYEENDGLERTDTIIFTTTGGVSDTVVITQSAAPPTLVVTTNDTTINHNAGDFTITFDLGGSAVGWMGDVTGAGFITINTANDTLASNGSVTIMATYEANDGLERMDTIILMTTGGASDTVVITQKAVPTLVITTNDMTIDHDSTGALAITFELGGSAMGWSGTVRGDNFITLNPADEDLTATGEVTIMAMYEENDELERTDTIIFTTTGGVSDTVVITQRAAPPTLVVTTNDTTINHNAGDFTITFDLGGSAVGWMGDVTGAGFITINTVNDTLASSGSVTIMATYDANDGLERTDSVILMTTGGVSDTVVITQKAVPTLVITTNDTTINHDATGSLVITFDLGGSAVGWSGTVRGDNFITLDTVVNASDTNQTVTITATYNANDGLERTDSVILMTTGGVSDTVVITQRAAPPTLVVTTNDATINHNAGDFTITFTLGGSAVGWSSEVIGEDDFITFDPSVDTTATGEVTIMAIPTENTGMERMDTIIFTTTGGVSDTVVITQRAAPPTLVVTTNDTTINDEEGSLSITFTLGGSAVGWSGEVIEEDDFITFDPSMDTTATGEVTITAMREANTGVERTDTIVFTTTDGVSDTVVITQSAAPPTLVVTTNDTTINHDEAGSLSITFTLGGTAKGWSGEVIGEDDFITFDMDTTATGEVTIMAMYEANTGVERKDTIVFTTTGGVADTVVITQEGAPPTLMVSTFKDTTINHNATGSLSITFTLGGSAVGWTGTVRTIIGENFITLTPNEDSAATGEINVMATYEANTGLRRKGSIIFTTIGGVADTVVITQSAGPPTLMVSMPIPKSGSDTTIAYGAITNVLDIITFTVRGGAAGWRAAVIDADNTHNFLTLNCCHQLLGPLDDIAGTHTIGITVDTENMGKARMDTVVITTVGGFGDPLKDTIVITQAGAPPTLDVSSPTLQEGSNDTTIAYDVGADPFDIITFEVGGGAESWMAAVIDDDNTNNFLELVEHGGTAGTGIIGVRARENTGGARMDTVVITTVGGFGDPLKDTIVITQAGAPPTLEVSSPTLREGSNDTTIAYGATINILDIITFEVGGGAESWMAAVIDDDNTNNFLELVEHGGTAGTGIIGVRARENMGEARMDTIVITTVGGFGDPLKDTVVITQSEAPGAPLLNNLNFTHGDIVTTIAHDDTTTATSISFTVAGGATGWSSAIIYHPAMDAGGEDFITLDTFMNANQIGEVTVMATPTSTNSGIDRIATITISTLGPEDDTRPDIATLLIRQEGAPPMLTLISDSADTIAYDATAIDIEFTVGGGATGWIAFINGDTLQLGNAGTSTINIPFYENTGEELMDTIVITTVGGTGEADTDTVIVTQEAVPTITLSASNEINVGYNVVAGQGILFDVGGSATGWTTSTTGDFVTISPLTASGTFVKGLGLGQVTTFTLSPNMGVERTAMVRITTTGQLGASVTAQVTITQGAAPSVDSPTLMVSTFEDTTIDHNAGDFTVTFTLGGTAVGWSSEIKGDDFITLDPAGPDNATTGEVSVTATYGANIGAERTDTIIFTTMGGVSDTVVITQREAPPTLEVSIPTLKSGSDTTIAYHITATDTLNIVFTVGGGSFAWRAAVIDADDTHNFLTLNDRFQINAIGTAGTNTISIISTENMGKARMDTVVITTVGGFGGPLKDTIVITQAGAPPTLEVSSPTLREGSNDTTIAYGATINILDIITFEVGGGAESWMAAVIDDDNTNNFLELVEHGGTAGTGIIGVRARENMGEARMDTIVITTVGGFGDPLKDTVVITQFEAPGAPLLNNLNFTHGDIVTTIAHDDTTTATSISFTVAGGATGWSSAITYNPATDAGGEDFITLDTVMNANQTGEVTVMATPTSTNSGILRIATITISTLGPEDDTRPDIATLLIRQEGAPPMLTLISDSAETIAYDATAIDIEFTVGGGATGWIAFINGDTLQLGNAGTSTINIPFYENTGEELMDTIVITTVGGTGEADTDTVIVTQEAVPTLVITTNDTTINHDATEAFTITFNVGGSATGWRAVSSNQDFIRLDTTAANSYGVGIVATVTPTENIDLRRSATITFVTTGQLGASVTAEVTITQGAAPPTLVVTMNDTTIDHNAGDFTITFDLGGTAVGWSAEVRGDDFITLDPAGPDNATTGEVSVTATYGANIGAERTDTIIFTTMGGVSDTVVITQREAPPTLEVSIPTLKSGSDTTIAYNIGATDTLNIVFTVGGGSFAWRAAVIDADDTHNFLTLNDRFRINAIGTAGTNTISIISTENMGKARMDTVVITTVGGFGGPLKDTIVITQAGAPPTLEVSMPTPKSGSDTTIAYGATINILDIITFEVGGGAESWMAAVIDDDNTNNFLELVEHGGTAGTGIIGVRARENTGGTRMDTIVITTDGGTGSAIDTIVVTQEAVPTITLSASNEINVGYNVVAEQGILFDVGGSATGWTTNTTGDFVTISPLTANGTFVEGGGFGQITTFTLTPNTGVERTAMVRITTTGQLGDSVTAQVTITQGADPSVDSPTLMVSTFEDTTINHDATEALAITFDLGGSAKGWSGEVRGDNFITLDPVMNASDTNTAVTIMAIPTKNTGMEQRTDTIILVTTGGVADTVVITQAEAPGAPVLNNLNFTHGEIVNIIAHDDTTTATSISFTVAGGATGWSSAITYHPPMDAGGEDFITLDTVMNANQTGEVTVMATPASTNSGILRIATITISTLGPEVDTPPDTVTLLIIQEGAPPMLTLTSDSVETIAYGAETASDITFEVGGGAELWGAVVIDDDNTNNFVTLSKSYGSAGLDMIKVEVSENIGLSRMDTIVITADGGTGTVVTDTIIITQEAIPTLVITTNDTTINHDDTEAFAITFNVGGSATGWRAVSSNQDFIRLDTTAANSYGVGIVATVTPTENIDLRRSATITFVTTGQLGDSVTAQVTITQGAAPPVDSPTLMVNTFEDTTINHNATDTLSITFDVRRQCKRLVR